jgi:GGDEF domain-containing protein
MRESVEELRLPHAKSKVNEIVTLSVGVVTVVSFHLVPSSELVARADEALYGAKDADEIASRPSYSNKISKFLSELKPFRSFRNSGKRKRAHSIDLFHFLFLSHKKIYLIIISRLHKKTKSPWNF